MTLWQDLRYGLKMMARSPGFTFAAVLSIALGIGVNTTIFSFINALLFRPLPFPEAQRLVRVWDNKSSSYPDYVVYRDEVKAFEGLAAYSQRPLSLNVGGETERVNGEIVSGNYFDVLGVRAARGRGFLAEEDRTVGTHPVVVMSDGLWRRRRWLPLCRAWAAPAAPGRWPRRAGAGARPLHRRWRPRLRGACGWWPAVRAAC